MRIGLSTAAFYGRMETEEAAGYLSRLPVSCAEVFLQTHSEYQSSFGKVVMERLASVPCVSIHPKGTQFEQDLFAQSPRQREDALRIFRGVLDAGQTLSASYYVLHGPFSVGSLIQASRIGLLEEVWPVLKSEAQQRGIELLWENVSWAALRTAADLRILLHRIPDLCFVLDVKQAMRASADPLELLYSMGNRLRHIHLMDWQEDGRLCLPGTGVFPFRQLCAALESTGYQGDLILEPYAPQSADEQKLVTSLNYLHDVFRC